VGKLVASSSKGHLMIKMLLFALLAFLIATFPATWLLMLFLGNFDTGLSYWGTLPMGALVSALLAGVSSNTYIAVPGASMR
jgi:hypothetical protein